MRNQAVLADIKDVEVSENGEKREPRILELDGIRGLAILLVLIAHIFYAPTLPGGPELLTKFKELFTLTWTGVDLFFVLSGFLIGGILLDKRSSGKYFTTFYARRFFRIVPVYYCWIILFILVVKLGGPVIREHTRSGILPAIDSTVFIHFLFLQNLWLPNYVKLAEWWFGATWSLAVEEQFYLVAPLL